jgi:hypothetical protein
MKVCISIDLDNYQDYQSLVDTRVDGDPPSFYTEALPRFLDLFAECGIQATFFAIGRDLARPENRSMLKRAFDQGHEVGNHSFSHPYNFRQLSREQKAEEIDTGHAAIADALGEAPVGFRTPSCEIDLEILELLEEREYLYDSSVFPSPLMWLFMIYGKMFIKREHYQLGSPWAALAPNEPYRPDRKVLHHRQGSGAQAPGRILEIPFSTLSPLRIPFYSTFLRILGTRFFNGMVSGYGSRKSTLHALFHQIEFSNFEGTELEAALAKTPALGAPFASRSHYMKTVMKRLAKSGESVSLQALASTCPDGRET